MIKLYFEGGLGNQMFQYVFGRYAQEYFQESVVYDISKYQYNAGEIRKFELQNFNIAKDWVQLPVESNILKKYDYAFAFYRLISIPYLLINRYLVSQKKATIGDKLFQRMANLCGYYRHYYGEYYDFFPTINPNKHFMGHWFRKEIVQKMHSIVKSELKVKTEISEDAQNYLDKIRNTNSVGVHIRRGDYVDLGMIVCDIEYYRKSMEMMSTLEEKPVFYIFSDDIEWVKENLITDFNMVFVEGNHSAVEDMKLLYSCNHFIMSNSTFSWWGAYLGSYPDKRVITPRYWENQKIKSDMILDAWTDVENF